MRKLATIQQISNLEAIPGADNIEKATILGWQCVVKKNQFQIGDLIIYCEIDSLLPIKPEYEFLRKSCYVKLSNDVDGFRIKTVKLRGQVSQGLILSLDNNNIECGRYFVGDDVSEKLNIIKYEPLIPSELQGKVKGNFPSFLIKTDEERIQNLQSKYENFKQHKFYVTEKLDGISCTMYLNNGEFGVCSKNLDFIENENNIYWKVANQLDIKNKLSTLNRNVAIQGEIIGEGIQKNKYKLNEQKLFIFNMFDIDNYKFYAYSEMMYYLEKLNLHNVPVLDTSYTLPNSINDLLLRANGNSFININTLREGLVIRSLDRTISFKVISNNFLIKHEE